MAGIKNWTVTAKTIADAEGAVAYAAYLVDENHPHHKNTEIFGIHGNARELAYRASVNATAKNEQNRMNRGGRPPSCLVSFNFVLPAPLELRPSKHEWQLITKDILREMSKRFDIPMTKMLKHCFINVHNQSNSHLNLAFANVWESDTGELETMRSLKQRGFLAALKQTFTSAANRVLKIDNEVYKPSQVGLGRRMNIRRALEELSGRDKDLNGFFEGQSKRLEKLAQAVEHSDHKQANRQSNRIARDFSNDPVIQSKLKKLLCEDPESFSSSVVSNLDESSVVKRSKNNRGLR